MSSVVVIQARVSSSRLPGKVLLPINGIPVAILAAQRAANTGRKVMIVTSQEASDDPLVETASRYRIAIYRGSLNDVLGRVVSALEEYPDDTRVIRLTADNVFPDGVLLDEIEQDFEQRSLDYLCCNGEQSGLPYGLSAEITFLCHLREASNKTNNLFDREHVTPYIRRKFGATYFEKYKNYIYSNKRCTIDCLDDYICVQSVFSSINDPVGVSFLNLIRYLPGKRYQPLYNSRATKLVLGTAQVGLNYGVVNHIGKPDHPVAVEMIKTAICNGVEYLDTARAYGDSENVIGGVLASGWEGRAQVITKLSTLEHCPADATASTIKAYVDASIYQSCTALRSQCLDVVLLHRAAHLIKWDGTVWQHLLRLKGIGKIKRLGVSVQVPEELDGLLENEDINFIQMPFNILDWRWDGLIPKIIKEKQRRDLIVHTRSALLQGVLGSGDVTHWCRTGVQSPEKIIAWLHLKRQEMQSSSIVELCLNHVRALDWVDGVVVGAESLEQVYQNIKIFCSAPSDVFASEKLIYERPYLEENSLNPACWS